MTTLLEAIRRLGRDARQHKWQSKRDRYFDQREMWPDLYLPWWSPPSDTPDTEEGEVGILGTAEGYIYDPDSEGKTFVRFMRKGSFISISIDDPLGVAAGKYPGTKVIVKFKDGRAYIATISSEISSINDSSKGYK